MLIDFPCYKEKARGTILALSLPLNYEKQR